MNWVAGGGCRSILLGLLIVVILGAGCPAVGFFVWRAVDDNQTQVAISENDVAISENKSNEAQYQAEKTKYENQDEVIDAQAGLRESIDQGKINQTYADLSVSVVENLMERADNWDHFAQMGESQTATTRRYYVDDREDAQDEEEKKHKRKMAERWQYIFVIFVAFFGLLAIAFDVPTLVLGMVLKKSLHKEP